MLATHLVHANVMSLYARSCRSDSEIFRLAISYLIFFFFFQAEDGIRDLTVTGVQTCALPIFKNPDDLRDPFNADRVVFAPLVPRPKPRAWPRPGANDWKDPSPPAALRLEDRKSVV